MTEYDGRITIQTSLDNSEFEAGSEELQRAIRSVSTRLQSISGDATSMGAEVAGAAQRGSAAIDQMDASARTAQATIQTLSEEAAALNQELANSGVNASYEEGLHSVTDTADAIRSVIVAQANLEQSPGILTTNEASERINNLGEKIVRLVKNVEKAGASIPQSKLADFRREAAALQRELAKFGKSKFSTEAFETAQLEYAKALQDLAQLQDEMEAFVEFDVDPESADFIQLSQSIEEATNQAQFFRGVIDGLEQEHLDIITARELDDFELLSQRLNDVQRQVGGIRWPSNPFTEIRDVSFTDLIKEKLGNAAAKMATSLNKIKDVASSAMQSVSSAVQGAFNGIVGFITHPIQSINNAFGALAQRVAQALSFIGQCASQGARGLWTLAKTGAASALRQIGSVAKGACAKGIQLMATASKATAKSLLSITKGSIISGFKRLGSAIKNASHHASKSSGGGLAGGLKKIMMYGLGIRSVFALVNKLRTALKDGMGNLAAYSNTFNTTMSNYASSLARLKNSLATAFEPILTAIMPAITALIDGVSEAMNRLAEFFAVLTGQNTYTAAKQYQVDYAKDIAQTTKETEDNTEATKENQKTLAGFDDVEILKEDKDTSTDSSTGGSTTDPSDMFETRSVGQKMKDLLDQLKNMWANADFSALGSELGQKLLDALQSIPWDKIRETANRLGQSFATLLNGVLSVPGLFYTIGQTLAQGLNTLFELLNGFVSKLNWASLGQAIKDGILGFTDNIDWSLIFDTFHKLGSGLGTALEYALDNIEVWSGIMRTVANSLNALIYGIGDFLHAVDWYSLASNIGEGLNTGIESLDWNALADLIATGINSVALAIDGFVTAVDWSSIGYHLADCINSIFYMIDWIQIGQSVCDSFNSVIDILYAFITTIDFMFIGESLGQSISTVINGVDWFKGGYSIGACIQGLYDAFNAFMDSTDWASLGRAVIDVIAGFLTAFNWGTIAHSISSFLSSCLDFFTGAIQEIDWVSLPRDVVNEVGEFLTGFDWQKLAVSVGELIGAAFKALVEAGGVLLKAMKEWGNDVAEGGLDGILEGFKSIGSWIKKNIFDPFMKGFKNAFGISSPSKEMRTMGGYVIDGLLSGIRSGISGIKTWLKTNVFDKFMTSFRNLFGINSPSKEMEKEGEYIPAGFQNGVKSGMKSVTSNAKEDFVNPYINAVSKAFGITNNEATEMRSIGQAAVDGFKSGVQTGLQNISSWLTNNMVNPILTTIRNGFGISATGSSVMQSYGSSAVNGFNSAFTSNSSANAVVSWANNIIYNISNCFGSNANYWYTLGANITIGLNNGMVSQCGTLYQNARNIANNIYNTIQSALQIHSPSRLFKEGIGKNIILGIAEGLTGYGDEATSAISQIADDLVEEAETLGPVLSMDPDLFGMDSVLEGVADRFVLGVDKLVEGLQSIVDSASFTMPAMTSGTVLPYAYAGSSSNAPEPGSGDIYGGSSNTSSGGLSTSDIASFVDRIIQAIAENRTTIGDEELYRSVNRASERLNRRFNK